LQQTLNNIHFNSIEVSKTYTRVSTSHVYLCVRQLKLSGRPVKVS